MGVNIATETTTVYRVGRRRFLTERAAFRHLARMRISELRPCECEAPESDDFGRTTYDGFTCARHRPSVVHRYGRILRRAWRDGWRPC